MAAFGVASRLSMLSKTSHHNRFQGGMAGMRGISEDDDPASPKSNASRRSSVTGVEPEVMMQRGWQVQRQQASRRSVETDERQELWKVDVPILVDPKLEEELRLRQARLTQLIEVNRALHNQFVKKKMATIELEEKSEDLQSRLEGKMKIEESQQRRRQQELEDALREEKAKYQATHQELSQLNVECEEYVRGLQDASRKLQEVNGNNRKLIKEQAMEIKERQKAIKDLQRHVHLVEGAENEKEDKLMPLALYMNSGGEDSRLGAQKRSEQESSCGDDLEQEDEEEEELDSVASEPVTFARITADRKMSGMITAPVRPSSGRRTLATAVSVKGMAAGYRRLPGLNLEKLLGVQKQASPPATPH